MLRFDAEESAKPRKVVPTHARVWHLAFMLATAIALMIWMGHRARQAETSDSAIPDLSGTSVVSAEQVSSQSAPPGDDGGDSIRMIELSRLREFVDHDTSPAAEPYYYLLDLARHNPAEWLEQHGRRDVTVAHLLREPDRYRGQLVLLRGRLRRLVRDELGDNDYGLTTRYEGWLYTEESGKYPYAVIVTDPPTGMPLGAINEYVTVAGYFLGWWRHQNQDDKPTSSPLILGRRFIWNQPPQRPDIAFAETYGLAIGFAVLLLAVATVYFSLRKGRSPVAAKLEREFEPLIFDEKPANLTKPDTMQSDVN